MERTHVAPASSSIDAPPALGLVAVSHRFGPVRALHRVDLEVRPGEVHALVGENGAGKSTLLKVVAGLLVPDEGTVEVHGDRLPLGDRAASMWAGVGVVHQHFSLVETLTGSENFALGRLDGGRLIDRRAAHDTLVHWSARTGLDLDPDVVVEHLAVSARQRLEILSTLGWGARVLLLDEPTAVLSPIESDLLLGVVRELAADGLAVVLVTHKLREVEEYADRVTVLRSGEVVGRHEGRVPRDQLVAELIGDHAEEARLVLGRRGPTRPAGRTVVRVEGLRTERLRSVDLELRAGQVTGIAAVAGSGQADLIGTVCGLARPEAGHVLVITDGAADDDKVEVVDIAGHPGRAARAGVALIPEDRERDAIAAELPVWTNAVAKRTDQIGRWFGIDRGRVRSITDRIIAALRVRPAGHDLAAGRLSGGNQQRLVIGRELDRAPTVVLAAEPTRGLDPGSALAVIDALRDAAQRGAAVLVAASDLDELVVMSDRILAMCDGRITLDIPADEADRQLLGHAMTGASP